MCATSFLVACMKKSAAQLRAADIASAARQHQIPESWARFYLAEELNRKGF